jgi:hypothetical protein
VTGDLTQLRDWHAALNSGDLDTLVSLAHDDVEIVGPRGTARGNAILRDWAARSGIRLVPLRYHGRDATYVVTQSAA